VSDLLPAETPQANIVTMYMYITLPDDITCNFNTTVHTFKSKLQ